MSKQAKTAVIGLTYAGLLALSSYAAAATGAAIYVSAHHLNRTADWGGEIVQALAPILVLICLIIFYAIDKFARDLATSRQTKRLVMVGRILVAAVFLIFIFVGYSTETQ